MGTLANLLSYNPGRRIQISAILWFSLALIAVLVELQRGSVNNYFIFKNVYWHTLNQTNLYSYYPKEYFDLNHYGPLFSIVILPFAILPDWLGIILWALVNAGILFYAIQQLPVTERDKNLIILISMIEMMTSIHNVQFNPMLTGWLLLSFVFILKDKIALASLLIIAGFLIKLYGLAGILFFFFARDRIKFSFYLLFWLIILFLLPMIISSPAFVFQSYIDWYHALLSKNAVNVQLNSYGIDISVMGMIRRIFNLPGLSNAAIVIPALFAITAPLFKTALYNNPDFKLSYLALVLISIVIFSSSAESPTYIIAVTGAAIWYIIGSGKSKSDMLLLGFVVFITSISATDLFPGYIKFHFIKPFSLKALPCFIVWSVLLYKLLFVIPEPISNIQLA